MLEFCVFNRENSGLGHENAFCLKTTESHSRLLRATSQRDGAVSTDA